MRSGEANDEAARDESEDLTRLADVHVGTVVEALTARALRGEIYSRCGPLLVAVNPYRLLPIYGDQQLERYLSSDAPSALPPHVYGVGSTVVQAFRMNHLSQAVIVSGESGAGKTETCKRLLEFLSAASAGGAAGSRNMHARVIQVGSAAPRGARPPHLPTPARTHTPSAASQTTNPIPGRCPVRRPIRCSSRSAARARCATTTRAATASSSRSGTTRRAACGRRTWTPTC